MKCESCIHSGMCKMEIAPNWNKENCAWSKPTTDFVPKSKVEWLQSQVNRLKKYDEERDIALHARLITNAKAKAIKEFAERLHNHFDVDCEKTHGGIDKVLEEMTEGGNE